MAGSPKIDKISSPTSSTATIPFYSKHLPLYTVNCSSRPRLSLITPNSLSKMPSHPDLGALGVTYTAMRAMQVICLIIMVGLSGNFVSEAVNAGYYAPPPLVGVLVVVSCPLGRKCTLLRSP